MINVMVVDDHALVRMGIQRLLDDLPDIKVVAEAASGEIALTLARAHKPDVVLLDMKMPGIDGWEVTRRLKKTHPAIKVIALTAAASVPMRVLQLGAMGYLTKECGPEEMALAIRKVAKGERYLSAEIAQQIAMSSLDETIDSPFDSLSEREMQVMLMITNGIDVQDVATQLFLTTKTINGYRYRIYEKLNIKNDVELTHLALKHGLVEKTV